MGLRKNDTIFYCPNTNCHKSYSRLEYVRRHAKSTHNCDIDPAMVQKVPRGTFQEPSSVTSPNRHRKSEPEVSGPRGNANAEVDSFPDNVLNTGLNIQPQHLDAGDKTIFESDGKHDGKYVKVTESRMRGPSTNIMRNEVPLPARSHHAHTIPELTSTSAQDALIKSLQAKMMEQQVEINQMKNELTRLRTSVTSVCDVISQSLRSFSDWNI